MVSNVSPASRKVPESLTGNEVELFTSGEMARLGDTTLRTVRFYEAEGLIHAKDRENGGHRQFARGELLKLQLISDLRKAGLSLSEIKELIVVHGASSAPHEAACRMISVLQRHVAQFKRRIDTLQRVQEELNSTVANLEPCLDCSDEGFPKACDSCEVTHRIDGKRVMHLLWKT